MGLNTYFRIDFKVLLLVYKCFMGLASSYLSDLLLNYEPAQIQRSSALFTISEAYSKSKGDVAFQHSAPRW